MEKLLEEVLYLHGKAREIQARHHEEFGYIMRIEVAVHDGNFILEYEHTQDGGDNIILATVNKDYFSRIYGLMTSGDTGRLLFILGSPHNWSIDDVIEELDSGEYGAANMSPSAEKKILELREKMPEGDTVEKIRILTSIMGRKLRIYLSSGDSMTFFEDFYEDPYVFEMIKGGVNTKLLKGHLNMTLPQYSVMTDTPWEWKRHIVIL